jgi:hypothetical protein
MRLSHKKKSKQSLKEKIFNGEKYSFLEQFFFFLFFFLKKKANERAFIVENKAKEYL